MTNTVFIEVEQFDYEEFYQANIALVGRYADLRVRAIKPDAAFRRVFGSVNCADRQHMFQCVRALEASDTYNALFDAKLKAIPVDELLNERRALHGYLDISFDSDMKESVRVAALKEACVLAGITQIDDAGRTSRVPTLADLYRDPPDEAEQQGAGLH